jgi:amino acid transporter/mannitol/fructose-specific phosphotransferase system IIA component (Ntr-type)
MKSLERSIGLGAVVAISISAMLGSGIFVLPGLAAAKTGPMVWLAYLAAGLGVLPAALSKSELATAMPTSGGTYVYLERAFGPLAGTVSGIGLWLSLLLKSAFALIGFSAYLSVLVEVPEKPVAITLLLAITALNIVGVSIIGKLQKVIVGIVLILLIIMSLYGLTTMDMSYFDAGFTKGTTGFLAAAAFVYVSYAGVTKVAAIAEEVKDPHRNLPLGILISWILVMLIYVFVVFVLVANVPYKELVDHNHTGKPDLAPIYTVAKILGGQTTGYIAAVFAVLTMTSMSVAGLLAASRFPFAMSRDQLLPEKLQGINEQYKTPVWSISVTAVAMAVSILFLPVEQIAKLASAFMIVAFMFICGTVVVLRESAASWYQPRFRAPLYPYIQIIGILTGATLLWAMGLTSIIAIGGICMIGGASYLAYGRYQTSRLGVVGRMGKRTDLVGSNTQTGADGQTGADVAPHALKDKLPSEAAVVVPLFGSERSPETLVEMGAALAHHRKLEVLHVTEVPEQMYLADVLDEDHLSIALSRRIHVMAEEEEVNLEYNTTVSHDVVKTIHNVADRLHCEWVVMEAAGRRTKGITFQNQLGWLQDHLPCNLAVFKDAGVRYIRKIIVFAEPGPHDSLVVTTADHLADIYKADLSFVCFVDDNEEPINVQAKVDYIDQLRDLCVNKTEIVKVSGHNEMLAIEKTTEKYDLLIMGAPPPRTFSTRLFGTSKDLLTRNAACSVLWLKTPVEQIHDTLNVVERGIGGADLDFMKYLSVDSIETNIKVQKKEELFRLATEKIADKFDDEISPLIIQTALWEREQLQVTSVGNGVAMPHATLSRAPTGSSAIAVFTLENEIDFGAPNGAKVGICFFTMGPPSDRQIHLEILSQLSKVALDKECLEKLRSAQSPEELYEGIRNFFR